MERFTRSATDLLKTDLPPLSGKNRKVSVLRSFRDMKKMVSGLTHFNSRADNSLTFRSFGLPIRTRNVKQSVNLITFYGSPTDLEADYLSLRKRRNVSFRQPLPGLFGQYPVLSIQ